jgi:acyl carrier protein
MNTMGHHAVIERLRAYVQENFLYTRHDVELRETESLFGRNIIDSLGVMELIAFVQSEFGVEVPDEMITEEHFGTLRAIANFVLDKRAAA